MLGEYHIENDCFHSFKVIVGRFSACDLKSQLLPAREIRKKNQRRYWIVGAQEQGSDLDRCTACLVQCQDDRETIQTIKVMPGRVEKMLPSVLQARQGLNLKYRPSLNSSPH